MTAVATGLSPLALATDAGGSIRRPCAYTGVVGLKPSIGQVPRCYGFPATAFDLQTIGPIARSVADVAMMFDAISGPDQRDRATLAFANSNSQVQAALDSGPLRILYVPRILRAANGARNHCQRRSRRGGVFERSAIGSKKGKCRSTLQISTRSGPC